MMKGCCSFRSMLALSAVAVVQSLASSTEKLPAQAASASAPGAELKPTIVQAQGFAETRKLSEIAAGMPALAPGGEGTFRKIPLRYFRRSPKAPGALRE